MADKVDNKALVDEYGKGASIQSLADKYDLEPAAVEAIVVKPVESAEPKDDKKDSK